MRHDDPSESQQRWCDLAAKLRERLGQMLDSPEPLNPLEAKGIVEAFTDAQWLEYRCLLMDKWVELQQLRFSSD